MSYTIQQLATLAGVSVRTLHYYDQIGLLSPALVRKNGYREYGERELMKLQQILFFRELEFPLGEIKAIMGSEHFDMELALKDHRKLLSLKQERLKRLTRTIDKTLEKITHQHTMNDQDLYGAFSKDEMEEYAAEAKERWGNTEAYRQSQERTKHWTKEDYAHLKADADKWMKHFVTVMPQGVTSPAVQELIGQHYNSLRTFYEPSIEIYRGLATMYVDDERFAKYYNKYHPSLAVFMRDAMLIYCDTLEKGR